jgi:transposase
MCKGDRHRLPRRNPEDAMDVVGIDVAKAKLAIVLRTSAGTTRRKSCLNTPAGHADLLRWLGRHSTGPVRVGLEATGGYQEAAALALHDAGHWVCLLNPAVIEAYGRSLLRRAKTDSADAALIAEYVARHTPPRWLPPPPEARQLQALVRRLEALLEMQTQEQNRLGLAAPIVRPSITGTLAHLAEEIGAIKQQIAAHIDRFPTLRTQRDLLVSIPGIGDTTAASVLGELLDPTRFSSAREMAAFSGLVPQIRQSGSSVRGRGTLSRIGPARLRKALYFPALTAMQHNVPLHRFAARLRAAGKPTMVIVAAVMRKLIHQIFGVLRSGRRYDPTYA